MTDPTLLREAFGQFGTGVALIGIKNGAGQPVGLTINSFASVSLAPPLLSWCLANESQLYDDIAQTETFSVNVLAAEQVELSNRMSRPGDHVFPDAEWHESAQGGVFVNNALAHFHCRVHNRINAGDHLILIGEIIEANTANKGAAPLLYFRGGYAELAEA